tara:strand:+ start:1121 stop:1312 length:192 start_codon:yes stop_codon:yes gene_type:complete
VYGEIATEAAKPPQLEHCHHASFEVKTCPVTKQLNVGRVDAAGSGCDTTGFAAGVAALAFLIS